MFEVETEDIIRAQNKSQEALSKIVEANTRIEGSKEKRLSVR